MGGDEGGVDGGDEDDEDDEEDEWEGQGRRGGHTGHRQVGRYSDALLRSEHPRWTQLLQREHWRENSLRR